MEAIHKLCPMTEKEKVDCVVNDSGEYREHWGIFDRTRRKSAEISFKAGYDKRESEFVYNPDYLDFQKGVETGRKLGLSEVVEWMAENSVGIMANEYAWEAKLEEWGLDEKK